MSESSILIDGQIPLQPGSPCVWPLCHFASTVRLSLIEWLQITYAKRCNLHCVSSFTLCPVLPCTSCAMDGCVGYVGKWIKFLFNGSDGPDKIFWLSHSSCPFLCFHPVPCQMASIHFEVYRHELAVSYSVVHCQCRYFGVGGRNVIDCLWFVESIFATHPTASVQTGSGVYVALAHMKNMHITNALIRKKNKRKWRQHNPIHRYGQ